MTKHELAFLKAVICELRDYRKKLEIPPHLNTHEDGWLDACNELLFFIHQHEKTKP